MTWAVRFEDVTKQYIGEMRHWHLRHDLVRIGRKILSQLQGQVREPEKRTALDHVSFEVQEGEAFALVGPNGAGKSTALKLLTRISHPTRGRIRLRGRIGALIEVGSGIHPELTGRENIWLYGRILGMSRREIARRFDVIVDFAELPHVLDIPVKMYSTGMQLRLGFSIASHLDPDIFVVDEVLAVGDASFQVKCKERMLELLKSGKTLLFVSHDLTAVETICSRGLYLLDGKVQMIGDVNDVVRTYLGWVDARYQERMRREIVPSSSSALTIENISFHDEAGIEQAAFRTGETVEIRLEVTASLPIERPIFSLGISDGRPGTLILCPMPVDAQAPEVLLGPRTVSCRINRLPLLPRVYQAWCSVRSSRTEQDVFDWQVVGAFQVAEGPAGNGWAPASHIHTDAPIHTEYEWQW